jgi:NAD+ synthase
MLVAKKFHVTFQTIDITRMMNAVAATISARPNEKKLLPYANLKARLRMIALYYFANKRNGLVVGTSDKSEMMLGYFTKYGDGASDIEPLADLYKTTVRFLGDRLGIPKVILEKPPSPELWPGQTAEKELGTSYERLDLILWALERWMTTREIAQELKVPVNLVNNIRKRFLSSEHKRRPPMILKMGYRTAGQDLRIPYSLSLRERSEF